MISSSSSSSSPAAAVPDQPFTELKTMISRIMIVIIFVFLRHEELNYTMFYFVIIYRFCCCFLFVAEVEVANIKKNTAVLTTDNLVYENPSSKQDTSFINTSKANTIPIEDTIVPQKDENPPFISKSIPCRIAKVAGYPDSLSSLTPVLVSIHSMNADFVLPWSVVKDRSVIPTCESTNEMDGPEESRAKKNSKIYDVSGDNSIEGDSIKSDVLYEAGDTSKQSVSSMYDDPYEDETLFDLARQSLLKQQFDQQLLQPIKSQLIPTQPGYIQQSQLPPGQSPLNQSQLEQIKLDILPLNQHTDAQFASHNPTDLSLQKSDMGEGIYSEFLTAPSYFEECITQQRDYSSGDMLGPLLRPRTNLGTEILSSTNGFNDCKSKKSTSDLSRLEGSGYVSKGGGSFRDGGIKCSDAVRVKDIFGGVVEEKVPIKYTETNDVRMVQRHQGIVQSGAPIQVKSLKTSQPVPQQACTSIKYFDSNIVCSNTALSIFDNPTQGDDPRDNTRLNRITLESQSASILCTVAGSTNPRQMELVTLYPELSLREVRHTSEPALVGFHPVKFYKLSSVYSGVNDDDDEEEVNDENYMDLQV